MASSPVEGQQTVFGTPVRVPKSAELVAAALRLQIVRGDLEEGASLPPETVLLQQFGVSRPTLREAFRILESERLITIIRGVHGGGRVHAPTGEVAARYAALVLQYGGATLRDVYKARSVIEPACARMLASHRTNQQLKELRAALAAETERTSPRDVRAAANFHRLVVELTGNQTLILLSRMIQHILELAAVSWISAETDLSAGRRMSRVRRAHEELVKSIENKDPEAAEQVWSKHLEETQAEVLKGAAGDTVLDLFT